MRCPFNHRNWRLCLHMLGYYEHNPFENEAEVRRFFQTCLPRPWGLRPRHVNILIRMILDNEENMAKTGQRETR